MQWNKYRLYLRAANYRYQNFIDKFFHRNLTIWDRLRLFFGFVFLLTILGVILFFSAVIFIFFSIIAFCFATVVLTASWFQRFFHKKRTPNTVTPQVRVWQSDYDKNTSTSSENASAGEPDIIDVEVTEVPGNEHPTE
ncbi:MAG: hypothetical protein Q4C96_06290 [Planctomycetia bacterium]|nr:hypothetical protein [Planctomycetia bacterium]